MGLKLANNAVTRLAATLTTASTSLSVTPGTGALFPALSAGDYFPSTITKQDGSLEIVKVTARSSDVFTIVRAQENTTSKAFSAGDRIELRMTAGSFSGETSRLEALSATAQSAADAAQGSANTAQASANAAQATANAAVPKAGGKMTGNLDVPSMNGGHLAGMRNRIINGNFSINQRGYSSGAATTAANQYTLDRWRVVTFGQSVAFSASGNGNQITAPSGGIEQVIEGANIEGGTYTLNWIGTATATVNGTARAKGDSFTLAAGANATVRFSSGTVAKVQLEPGEVPTLFEHRHPAEELALCKWYFQVVYGFMGFAASSGTAVIGQLFFSKMRTFPSVDGATQAISVADSINAYTQSSPHALANVVNGENGLEVVLNNFTGLTALRTYSIRSGGIKLSAEL